MEKKRIGIIGIVITVFSLVAFIPLWFVDKYWGNLYLATYTAMQNSSITKTAYNIDASKLTYYNSMQTVYAPYFIVAALALVIGIVILFAGFIGDKEGMNVQ